MFSYKHKQWSSFSSFKKNINYCQQFTSQVIIFLDLNKLHGHDMISIRMIKIWDASICKLPELIVTSCLENEKFLTEWKKTNAVPANKKGDKQNLKS